MAKNTSKRFRAVIEPLQGGLGWVVARLPFDVDDAWPKMVRLRVKVEVGGEVFRTSLFPDAHRRGHFVLVNKKMQKAAGAKVGGMVDFAIAPDLEERTPTVPTELPFARRSNAPRAAVARSERSTQPLIVSNRKACSKPGWARRRPSAGAARNAWRA